MEKDPESPSAAVRFVVSLGCCSSALPGDIQFLRAETQTFCRPFEAVPAVAAFHSVEACLVSPFSELKRKVDWVL